MTNPNDPAFPVGHAGGFVMQDNEINELVARKLGWTCHEHPVMEKNDIVLAHGWVRPNPLKAYFHEAVPDYCHSIEAAWKIVEKMQAQFDYVEVIGSVEDTEHKWSCGARNGTKWSAWQPADTAPRAICLAFLKLKEDA